MVTTVTILEETPASSVPSPQEILLEIRNFVRGTSFAAGKYSRVELTRSALYLLKCLPSAREAILEYLRTIFDDALNVLSFNLELENGQEATGPINLQAGASLAPAAHLDTENKVLQDVQDILSSFIVSNPEGWSSIISAWSLDLLGQLSSKFAERRGVLHSNNLNEVLQLWMSCRPMKILIELSTQCISTLINSNPDLCIDALLETSVQQSPHFDWVVAHIGSCFPTTIINRVLACGLKDFCFQDDHKEQGYALLPTPDKKVPKMASVVGILGHLAGQHDEDIRCSLLQMFESSFDPNPTDQQLATLPFLLHLSSMSSMLPKVITADVIKALTPEVMNILCIQIPKWQQKANPQDPSSDLMNLVVHLVLQSDEAGWDILEFLLNTASSNAEQYVPQVIQTCGQILDYLLLQIQRLVFTNSPTTQLEIPILSTLDQHLAQLCQQMLDDNLVKSSWASKLLLFLTNHRRQSITSDIIAYVLCESKTAKQLLLLAHFMPLIEPTSNHQLLETTIAEIFSKTLGKDNMCSETFLTNLWLLIQWESKGFGGFGKTRLKFTSALNKFHVHLSKQLTHPSVKAASYVMDTLAWLPLPETVSVATLTSLSSATISYFFLLFSESSLEEKMKKIPTCCTFISKLSHHACAQNLILRSLLEGILLPVNSNYFGSVFSAKTQEKPRPTSLLEENNKHSISITLPQSHSTVFHAGIIGEGRRRLSQQPTLPKEEILMNIQLFLDVIKASCVPCAHSDEKEIKNEPTPTLRGMKMVALLLVELVSSDVMFNGLPWPDEDFIKVTMERDLHIKRMFDENPVLWDLLLLMATYKPALCYCSVLLRALAAVNMTFWAACRGNSAKNYPKELKLAEKLVNVMAIGQLIPPPISHVGEIFSKISPYEIYVLLQDTWKYMKANVPAPTVFSSTDSQGYPYREFVGPCSKEYTSRLHRILQNNIGSLGHMFIRFFSLEDADEN